MVAILLSGNILEVMTEEVYKQNFTDTYVFIKSKKGIRKRKVEMDGCGLINTVYKYLQFVIMFYYVQMIYYCE